MLLNAIVYDLELVKRFKKGQFSEIVEIGACKVNLDTKSIVDQFQIYTTPKSGYVSKSTRKFIKMKQEDLKNAVPFDTGIQKFASWLGDDYYLCSWGKDDKTHIINQCTRTRVNLDWFKNYNDIQKQISKLLTPENMSQLGLKNALNLADLEPMGIAHRGIDDAINTAQLLIKFIDKISFIRNTVTKNEVACEYKRIKQMIQQKNILKATYSKQDKKHTP
jgi:inhibitor of KinA sporulation pathway (predicted exonuclease)